jgi:peroxiredoxin
MKRALLLASMITLLFGLPGFAQLASTAGQNAPKVGDAAPDFPKLKDYAGKKKVLLEFFPGAFTPGCTQEFTENGQNQEKFDAMNIAIIGVSRDLPGAQNAFKKSVGAKNDFVSDPELATINKYDALNPQRRVASRFYFLIDENGKIVWRSVTGQLIPTDQLLDMLSKLSSK